MSLSTRRDAMTRPSTRTTSDAPSDPSPGRLAGECTSAEPPHRVHRARVGNNVDGPVMNLPGVGPSESRDDRDERRLAGTVGPKEPEDLPRAHLERDAVEGDAAPVRLTDFNDAQPKVGFV